MISLASGIMLVVAFAAAFIVSRLIVKTRTARAATQARLHMESIRRNAPPPAPSKNKSKRRRQQRTQG
ncbi:hypothetical protein CR155_08035 [Pollutimonas nitritireducens]|uniref:Uncharacterized protein n=1 Tax=Pollutimonas nitritireducens TaxID=2045209 RepID=A0A2N4UGB5_9BURK|nr:hypothetical protein CR155_08035 [Pollutimonas nitritireducens]